MLAYLDVFLELGHTKKFHQYTRHTIVELAGSDTDMQELGFSEFQSKKVKQRLPHPYHS